MLAYRTYIRCILALYEMSAVAAFPKHCVSLVEYCLVLNVAEKCTISFFVSSFDCQYSSELFCQFREALFIRFSCHSGIHVSPFSIFALCCVKQVFGCVTQFSQCLELELSVFLLVFCSLQE